MTNTAQSRLQTLLEAIERTALVKLEDGGEVVSLSEYVAILFETIGETGTSAGRYRFEGKIDHLRAAMQSLTHQELHDLWERASQGKLTRRHFRGENTVDSEEAQ